MFVCILWALLFLRFLFVYIYLFFLLFCFLQIFSTCKLLRLTIGFSFVFVSCFHFSLVCLYAKNIYFVLYCILIKSYCIVVALLLLYCCSFVLHLNNRLQPGTTRFIVVCCLLFLVQLCRIRGVFTVLFCSVRFGLELIYFSISFRLTYLSMSSYFVSLHFLFISLTDFASNFHLFYLLGLFLNEIK